MELFIGNCFKQCCFDKHYGFLNKERLIETFSANHILCMLLFYYYLFQLKKYIIKIFLKRDLNSDAIRDYLMMTWVISLPVSTFTDFTSQNFLLITELLPNTSSLLRRPYINSRSWKQQSLEVSWFSSPDPCKVNTQVQTDLDLHFIPSKNS